MLEPQVMVLFYYGGVYTFSVWIIKQDFYFMLYFLLKVLSIAFINMHFRSEFVKLTVITTAVVFGIFDRGNPGC